MRGLALGVLLALSLALVVAQTSPSIQALFSPVREVAGDVQALGTRQESRSDGEPGLVSRMLGHAEKDREIARLRQELAKAELYRLTAYAMAERLEAYQSMLGAIDRSPFDWRESAKAVRVAAETDGPFAETLLADAGRRANVQEGHIAFNEGGLVGRVVAVGRDSARILQVTDFNSRVPVMGEASGLRAILHGGRDRFGTLMDRPEEDAFLDGERILTSGEGGVFPRGILVGEAFRTDEGPWRVDFAMRRGRGGYVFLMPAASIPTPEDAADAQTNGSAVAMAPDEGAATP